MTVNSSTAMVNTSIPSDSLYIQCLLSVASSVIFCLYTIFSFFVVTPHCVLILYMGFQQWRHHHSSPARKTMSTTDFYTYNIIIVEFFGIVGSVVYSLGIFTFGEAAIIVGAMFSTVTFPGQTLYHLLTCVERYVAVVHPVAYMQLREKTKVRIRNISAILVWLFCFGWIGLAYMDFPNFPVIPLFSILGICIFFTAYCSLSVLYALVCRATGPRQEGGKKQHVDQSKKRAFQMILAIAGTLLLRSTGLLFWLGIINLESFQIEIFCLFIDLGLWLMVPSTLVLPLLYLHRAGKLALIKTCKKSGK